MMKSDFLYGVEYNPETIACPECKGSDFYPLSATNHFLCLDCSHQFPFQD